MSQDRNENRRRQQLLKNAGYSVNIDGSWGPYQNKLWMHYLGNQVQQKNPSYSVAPTVIAIPGGAGVAAAARYAPQVVRYLQGLAATGAIAENFTDGSELGTASQLAPFAVWNRLRNLFPKREERSTSYNNVNNTQPRNQKGKGKGKGRQKESNNPNNQGNKNPEPPKDSKGFWKTKTGKVTKGALVWQGVATGGDLLNNVVNHTNEDYQWGLTSNASPFGLLTKGSEAFRKPTETPTAPKATTPQERYDYYWKQYENY